MTRASSSPMPEHPPVIRAVSPDKACGIRLQQHLKQPICYAAAFQKVWPVASQPDQCQPRDPAGLFLLGRPARPAEGFLQFFFILKKENEKTYLIATAINLFSLSGWRILCSVLWVYSSRRGCGYSSIRDYRVFSRVCMHQHPRVRRLYI